MEKPTFTFTPEEQALNARLLAALPRGTSINKRDRIVDYEVVEMAALFREGNPDKLTAEQVLVAYLNRIGEFNGTFETYDENGGYNAFVRIDVQEALDQAKLADAWLNNPNDQRGPAPPLCGIPMGVKDSIGIQGRESKNGTHTFSGNVAVQDATCVAKLRAQGAVLIGHTICSEYSGTIDGDFGGNAWDPTRVPGGSSSGSAIAPVARLCAGALGEETGGSLIIPAAANGASGIKPSLGLVSTAGVMPLTMGFDVVGPIARSVRDASLILSLISGIDQFNDPLTLSAPIPALQLPITASGGDRPLQGLTIGIPQTDWMSLRMDAPADTYDADYLKAFDDLKEQLIALGANLIDFPGLDMMIPDNCTYYMGLPIYMIDDPSGYPTAVSVVAATSYPRHYEADYWQAIITFSLTRPPEVQQELRRKYDPQFPHSIVSRLPFSATIGAENRRRQQQALWQAALDDYGVDFMLVLPLGSHVGLRFDSDQSKTGIQNRRQWHDLPNALGWPMVTFPIGYGSEGVAMTLPVNAAFWGPRFSEVLITQAAIDYQARHPEHHHQAPPDPVFGPMRPLTSPRVREVTPDNATDPLIRERGRPWMS